MSVFMDSLPPKRLHSPAWGRVSLTSGQKKRGSRALPAQYGDGDAHFIPSFSVLTQLHPPHARCLPSRSPEGSLSPENSLGLLRGSAEGGSCVARREGEGTQVVRPPGIHPLMSSHTLQPSPHRPRCHRAGSLPRAPRGSHRAAATSALPGEL